MSKSFLTLSALVFTMTYIYAQSPTPFRMRMDKDEYFVAASSSRLVELANASHPTAEFQMFAESVRAVRRTTDNWQATKSQEDWIKLTDAVHVASARGAAVSQVSISTSSGPGASVKYQTIGERGRGEPATTAKSPTTVKESMLMGMYYIWSERSGKPTSDKDARFPIVNLAERVVLSEH